VLVLQRIPAHLASGARLDTAKAQLATDQTIFHRTEDLKKTVWLPAIDVVALASPDAGAASSAFLAAQNQYAPTEDDAARTIVSR